MILIWLCQVISISSAFERTFQVNFILSVPSNSISQLTVQTDPNWPNLIWLKNIIQNISQPQFWSSPVRGNLGFGVALQVYLICNLCRKNHGHSLHILHHSVTEINLFFNSFYYQNHYKNWFCDPSLIWSCKKNRHLTKSDKKYN